MSEIKYNLNYIIKCKTVPLRQNVKKKNKNDIQREKIIEIFTPT